MTVRELKPDEDASALPDGETAVQDKPRIRISILIRNGVARSTAVYLGNHLNLERILEVVRECYRRKKCGMVKNPSGFIVKALRNNWEWS